MKQAPTLEEMFLETDRSGKLENYLASEEQFQWLKQFEAENRLIPIVGDFAGTHGRGKSRVADGFEAVDEPHQRGDHVIAGRTTRGVPASGAQQAGEHLGCHR